MFKLQVTADKLNIRNSPSADTPDNWIGDMKIGEVFEAVNKVKGRPVDGNDDWFVDNLNRFTAAAWVDDITNCPDWMVDLGLPQIWRKYNEKGANVKVAVIDSGFNVNNTEISKGVKGEYVDATFPPNSINDIFGHGSYCASIIGARNLTNIIGCAPESMLYIAKMTNSDGYRNKAMYAAIDWAVNQKVDIISISQGGDSDANINTLVQSAIKKNILVVAAIGNNNDTTQYINGGNYPALCDGCLSVGATDENNKLATVTLINSKTIINAPGVNIPGYILHDVPEQFPSGTSQATAIVAGICALIISRHKVLQKSYSVKGLIDLISQNSEPIIGFPGQKLISPGKIFSNI